MSEKNYEVLSTESGEFRTTFNKAYLNRKKWGPANPRNILAFRPGSVVEYRVKVGDKVRKGDCLMTFRAMKMNNNVLSPIDGVVKKIDAEVGANVPKDTLLIEFE